MGLGCVVGMLIDVDMACMGNLRGGNFGGRAFNVMCFKRLNTISNMLKPL